MFLPDETKYPKPWPGVLVVCGHSANGKAYDGYQRATALLALNGIAGFIIDPVGQGERSQLLNAQGKPRIGGSTNEHTMLGLGAVLIGRNTAHYEIWDGMRGIDYLQSRPDIDADRIGCMGNSGGGTQSAYLMALDERIVCASPSCYITSFERLLNTIGPQDAEQNIAGQIAFGMNHADYILMRAPRPTLLCVATKDYFPIDGAWDSFRQAKRLYTRMGFAERVNLVENDNTHGYKQPLREAAVQWMVRWLRKEDRNIRELDIDVLTDKEIQCTPHGQVMLIDDAVSAFELNVRENQRLVDVRKTFWKETPRVDALAKVRQIAGVRSLEELKQQATADTIGGIDKQGGYFRVKSDLRLDEQRAIPVLYLSPQKTASPEPVLYVSDAGLASELGEDGPIMKLVSQGRIVVAVDVSGVGETASTNGVWYNKQFGSEGKNVTLAYLLGKSLLGMRTEEIIAAAAVARQQAPGDPSVELIASGAIGPAALHAAALEPELFTKVRLEKSLASFTSLVETPVTQDQWQQIVHGALRIYDLPDLAATLGERVEFIDPVNAAGETIQEK